MDNNREGEALTTKVQYDRFNRAIRYVLKVDATPDEYYAILQLMNELPETATLVLDETHEDIQ